MGASYTADRLARLRTMHRAHFWYVQRRRLLVRLLVRHLPARALVADVGCGPGDMTRWLLARGHRVIAVDMLAEGLAELSREISAPASDLLLAQASAEALPVASGALDAILLLDVLEHLDDTAALREARRALKPGGLLLAAVPVCPWLWGVRDVDAGHRRRYAARAFVQLLRAEGFDVAQGQHYQCLLFPLLIAARLLGRTSRRARDREDLPGPLLNGALGAVSAIEVGLGRFIRWPVGSSLIVVAFSRPVPRGQAHRRHPDAPGESA